MKSSVAILSVVALASVPLWLRDPYLMNALITTGIFIIGAIPRTATGKIQRRLVAQAYSQTVA